MLASVAEQASLSLTWSETPKDTFSHDEAQIHVMVFIKILMYNKEMSDFGGMSISHFFWGYCKNPKNSDTRKNTVIILKLEPYCFTTE